MEELNKPHFVPEKRLPPYLHLLTTVVAIPTSTQNGCHHTYIYSKRLPPYLHLLKTVAAIPTSTQNGCRHTYIYSKWLPPYLHLLKTVAAIPTSTQKKRRERFPIHKIRRINGGRGSQTGRKVLRIGGNTFYDWKNRILMKIPEFKRSGIGIIAEFCGIPSGFPNQDHGRGGPVQDLSNFQMALIPFLSDLTCSTHSPHDILKVRKKIDHNLHIGRVKRDIHVFGGCSFGFFVGF
jgi:hypothetical protein